MLRSINKIIGYTIQATDGELGIVEDFLFDDGLWIIRHLVIKQEERHGARHVLICPDRLKEPVWGSRLAPVSISKKEALSLPEITADLPLSSRKLLEQTELLSWSAYWAKQEQQKLEECRHAEDGENGDWKQGDGHHLRSCRHLSGYDVRSKQSLLGPIEEFIADTENWGISGIVIRRRKRDDGERFLVPPLWVSLIDWKEKMLRLDLDDAQIENMSVFDPKEPVNPEKGDRYTDYYGRPVVTRPMAAGV